MTTTEASPAAARLRAGYEAAVICLLLGASGFGLVRALVSPAAAHMLRILPAPQVWLVTGLGLAGGVMVVAGLLGPLWITAAEDHWRSPRVLLGERRRSVVAASLVGAVLCGATGVAAVPSVLAEPVLGGGIVIVLAAAVVAVVGQQLDLAGAVRAAGAVLGALSLVLAAQLSGAGRVPATVAALGALAVVVGRTTSTRRRPAHRWRSVPPRWELRRAGQAVEAARMSAVQLDSTAFRARQDAELAPRRRPLHVPPAVRPLVRVAASPPILGAVPLLAVPAVVAPLAGGAAAVSCLLVLTYASSVAAGRPLDALVDSTSLARAYALSRPPVGVMLAGTAVCLTASWALLAGALAGLGVGWSVVATALAGLAWVRRRAGRRLAGRVGALVATPMGTLPVDLAQRVLAGADVLLLGLLVLPGRPVGEALLVVFAACGAYVVTAVGRGRRQAAVANR